MIHRSCAAFALITAMAAGPASSATVVVFENDLAGFNAAADSPPVQINFDDLSAGSTITGAVINGVTFLGPGAPLVVVRAADTMSPPPGDASNVLMATSGENVLSPGGAVLGFLDPAIDDDDLELSFATPVSSFGFDLLSQSADGVSLTAVAVFDALDNLLFENFVTVTGPEGGPAGNDFWGIISSEVGIARIVFDEFDDDAINADANIGFDTFRFSIVPEPSAATLIGITASVLAIAARLQTWYARRTRAGNATPDD